MWQANIDWVAEELAPHGYTMVCTDGWIDGDQDVTSHGYIKSLSDDWEHDWAWWADYLDKRGMQLGVYYNPLWATKSAVTDRSVKVVGRPDVAVADIVNTGDFFDGGGQLQWVDASRDGAEEYVRGYVEYFRDLGAVFLRIDFLGWYEIGYDQNEGTIGTGHGRESYVRALQWMREGAGPDMQLSLVMPNLFDHAAAERLYGDLVRIDNDATFGQWYHLSGGRQTWQPIWSQWNNPFLGFTGFSDVSGHGQLVLDGDPLLMSTFTTDTERRTAVNLFTMAGAPIAVGDQYDTIGGNADLYTNPEVLSVRRAGLVGKPLSSNPHAYDYDQTSRDPERWIGQLPDGSWVVGLFNRTDGPGPSKRTIDFAAAMGLTGPAKVRDLWAHQDLGAFSTWGVTLAPHASALVTVTPQDKAALSGGGGRARRVGEVRQHLRRPHRHGVRHRPRHARQQPGHRRGRRQAGDPPFDVPGGQRHRRPGEPVGVGEEPRHRIDHRRGDPRRRIVDELDRVEGRDRRPGPRLGDEPDRGDVGGPAMAGP